MEFLHGIFLADEYKFCPSLCEIVGIRIPSRNFRAFPVFTTGFPFKNYPSAR